ncbi:YgaP family membrane protein [Sphingobacterium sp. Mn56C]|uniref:YgaP family membrane protein n=1 Tax=Sphingobacterium sp. Mn56C TaxID=3395261 RepID=UPI003BED1B7F
MNALINYGLNKLKAKVDEKCIDGNVGTSERILSVVAGGFILGVGIKKIIKNPISALTGLSIGGALIYRGITGHCTAKSALEKMTNKEDEVTVIEHRYFVK